MTETALDAPEPFDGVVVECSNCGVVHDPAMTLIAELREQIDVLSNEFMKKAVANKALRKDQSKRIQLHPRYNEAMDVLEHWRTKCHPGARELGGERVRNVIARLEGKYTVQELKSCADGYSYFGYVVNGRRVSTGTPAQHRVDAELVYRDPQHVDAGLRMVEEYERRTAPIPELPADEHPHVEELSDMGRAASRLAEFGWSVFPCAPRGKVPVTPNGLLDATQDLVRITRFWAANPEHNIAVRCGAESDLVVLDVDGEVGFDSLRGLEERFGDLPTTVSVKTPGGGQHYYFHHPGKEIRNTTGFPGTGLDVRGDGGYVLVPPSMGPMGRRYVLDDEAEIADMPPWLLDLLSDRQRGTGDRVDDSVWEAMVTKGVDSGERNAQLTRLAGYLWSHGLQEGIVLGLLLNTNRERCSPPLSDREVTKIVGSVKRMRERDSQ